MKNFVDHFAFLFHRPVLINKPAIVVATTEGSGLKETLKYLKFTAIGFGCNLVGELGVMNYQANTTQYAQKVDEQVETLAAKFVKSMQIPNRKSPTL